MPAVSVIMPVYNSAKYLQKAIDSILNQTFVDFELIIINDCSTDNSADIIKTYSDTRIKYIEQPQNSGVVLTQNKGLETANAPLVAIMHADDISFAGRLEKQVAWMNSYPKTAVTAGFIININEQDETTGEWKEDRQNVTPADIRNTMIKTNCIAHPSVMMRTEVVKKYYYQPDQKYVEDYDLWLKLLADGYVIEKVPENVLLYRVHQSSITGSILRKGNPFFKQYNCKRTFLKCRINAGKWGVFEMQVLLSTLYDGVMGIGKNIKNVVKS